MTTKPELIKWIPDDDPTKISDPGTTKRAAGWLYKEKPAYQFWNWVWNRVSKWFLGLQGSYFDIVVGSALQVTNNEATHVLADLNDALVVAGSRVLFLDGTHVSAANLSLSNDDLKITSESPLAILDVATYTATFSGARDFILLRAINVGAGDIVVSGAGSTFEGIDVNIDNVTVSGGAVARTSGPSGGLEYPKLKTEELIVDGLKVPVVGSVLAWLTTSIPSGWLELDGAQVSRTSYSGLFAVLGTTFGVGDGSTTFNLPDLRGESLRGWDHGAGVDPDAAGRTDRGDGTTGDNIGTKQTDAFQGHNINTTLNNGFRSRNDLASGGASNAVSVISGAVFDADIIKTDGVNGTPRVTSETRPRNVNTMFIIKY